MYPQEGQGKAATGSPTATGPGSRVDGAGQGGGPGGASEGAVSACEGGAQLPEAQAAAAAAAAREESLACAQRLLGEWAESMDDAGTPKRSLLPEHVW